MLKKTLTLATFWLASALASNPINWAEQTLQSLSLDEKIGQLFIIGVRSNPDNVDDELFATIFRAQGLIKKHDRNYALRMINQYHVGGVLYICHGTPLPQRNLTNELQKKSKLPLLFVQDAEWGLNMRLKDAIRFPRNMTLGALQNDTLVYDMGKEVARQCNLMGIHMNFAPVIDVNNNPLNPIIHDRSFGENKYKVATKGTAFMQGLHDGGVIACPKHFPGHGDVSADSHTGLPTIPHTLKRLHDIELHPFKHLINHGAQVIMTAHLHVPALDPTPGMPSSISPYIVTDLLKKELGFTGLVVSDGLVMEGITNYCKGDSDVALQTLLAGNDILLFARDVPKMIERIKQATKENILTEADIDQRVLKILRAKQRCGLHKKRLVDQHAGLDKLNSPYAYKLKKQLFSQAITLVKNNSMLPIETGSAIALVQVDGQPKSTFSQTLQKDLQLTYHHLSAQASETEINNVLKKLETKDVIIFGILGMNKFSTFAYKKGNSASFGISQQTKRLIRECNKKTKTVLTLFGSPYSLKLFGDESAIVVAYEDDSDAQEAAARTILGQHKPTGTLPVTASEQFPEGYSIER